MPKFPQDIPDFDLREVHYAWEIRELYAKRVIGITDPQIIQLGLSDLGNLGTFNKHYDFQEHDSVLKDKDWLQAVRNSFAIASEIARDSGVFMVAGGQAMVQLAIEEIGDSKLNKICQSPSIDLFIMEEDQNSFVYRLNHLGIKMSLPYKSFEDGSFTRVNSDFSEDFLYQLCFTEASFLPRINFYVIRNHQFGYEFNLDGESFIYPEKYIANPRLIFSFENSTVKIGLLDFPVLNYLSINSEQTGQSIYGKQLSMLSSLLKN